MPTPKKIRFDYFRPCQESDTNRIVDLTPFLEHLSMMPSENKSFPYFNGHIIRILKINYHEKYTFQYTKNVTTLPFPVWQINFTRSRPDLPGVLRHDAEELVALQLEDDEYISEDTVMLYDPQKHIVIMQRNLTGTPPTAVQTFFNKFVSTPNENIKFQALIDENALSRATSHQYHKSLHFRLTNLRSTEVQNTLEKNKSVAGLIKTATDLATDEEYPIQAELIIKIPGRSQKTFKHKTFSAIINTLKPLTEDKTIDKFLVKGCTDESSQLEEVDLIEEIIREWHTFKTNTSRFIPTSEIFERLVSSYAEKRFKIPNIREDIE